MKRFLITGASRGIGRAIAEKLAADNAVLLLHGRDTVALAQTRKAVEPRCAEVVLLVHDLAKRSGVSDLIAQVGNAPIDLLVNNAGVAVVKRSLSTGTQVRNHPISLYPRATCCRFRRCRTGIL